MNSTLPTGLVYSEEYQQHLTGPGHPEAPTRTGAVFKALQAADLESKLTRIPPKAAADADILRVHSRPYFETARRDVAQGRSDLSTGDTVISAKSFDIALLAAGGVVSAVDEVMAGKVKNAFCVVRPPGHHACPSRGMGFCLFNNIATGVRYAQAKHKIGKVLIADWDVHHGNGTQDVFYEDGSVLFFDSHQHPWYPGTGAADEKGTGKGHNCIFNNPFPAGSGRKEILGAFQDKLIPAAQAFKPDMVFISAGFDSRVDDPLGQFRLEDEDFAALTEVMLHIAKEHCGGRLVSVLEGGYNLKGLGRAAATHVKTLMDKA